YSLNDAHPIYMEDNCRVSYEKTSNQSNAMVSCQYFTTNFLKVDKALQKENTYDSFVIYICVEGEAELKTANHSEVVKKGETILLPAALRSYQILSQGATLLEVYV